MVGEYIRNSEIINNSLDVRYINLGTSASIDDIGKRGISKLFRYLRLLWQVMVQMITFRPQKVYLTLVSKGPGFYKDALVAMLAKMLGGELVYHFHNKGVKTRQHKAFDNWLYKKVFNGADVILLSEHLYPDVEKYVSPERVHICPNGIPDQITSNEKEQTKPEKVPVQLLFLSNLMESKGVFELLETCKILKSKGCQFTCVFVGGEGDIKADRLREKIADSDLEEEVMYAGKKYNEEKEAIFASSDIFVHPTWNDCFPLVLLEAMQAKLPIVSTPEGGIPGIVQDGKNGFLVPQKETKALAERLEELIKKPQKRKEMGQKGYEKYCEEFTLRAFEERFVEILQRINDA